MKRFEDTFPDHPKGGYLYLASQFRKHPDSKVSAYLEASSATAALWRAGVNAFSPIASFFPIATLNGIDRDDHDWWMAHDLSYMRASIGLIVLQSPGYKQSVGISEEIAFFQDRNSPCFSLDWPLKKLKDHV